MAQYGSSRAVSDRVFNGYLWPLAAWAIGQLFLYAGGQTPFGLWLLFPLAAWYGVLSFGWGLSTHRRVRAQELNHTDVRDGVGSIGRFMAAASLSPALVFMVMDPLSPSTWGTCAGVGVVAGIAWGAANTLPALERRSTHWIAVFVAWGALPLNASGALSLASWLGWFGGMRTVVGM